MPDFLFAKEADEDHECGKDNARSKDDFQDGALQCEESHDKIKLAADPLCGIAICGVRVEVAEPA
jgi:hypothetical protein